MADQRIITAYEHDPTPTTVVLRELPVADVAVPSVCYLYPADAPAPPGGDDPCVMTCRENNPTPTTIVLDALPARTVAPPNVIITLRDALAPEGYTPPPPPTFWGVLKRWTGAAWVKAKLLSWVGGSWIAKPLKRWTGSEWGLVDTTGV